MRLSEFEIPPGERLPLQEDFTHTFPDGHRWGQPRNVAAQGDVYGRTAYVEIMEYCWCGALRTWRRDFNPYGTEFYTDQPKEIIPPYIQEIPV